MEFITVYHAVSYFHFKISLMMNLLLKILQLKPIMTYIYIGPKLKDNCLQFDINSFKYSDYNPCDFENDIDPDTNFYNNLTSKCEYYTDSKFTAKISKINGLSYGSRNKNFQKIN